MSRHIDNSMIMQKTVSSVLIILGIILLLFMNNNITARVIEESSQPVNPLESLVILWAILLVIIGIFIWFKKDVFKFELL